MLVGYDDLCEKLRSLGDGKVIGIEGFCSSGKTALADQLSSDIAATVIHADDYCTRRNDPPPYVDGVNISALKKALNERATDKCCIIESICLRDLLSKCGVAADAYVYIKKKSTLGLWHDGLHLEGYEDGDSPSGDLPEPHASDFAYHSAHRPHERADWTVLRIAD